LRNPLRSCVLFRTASLVRVFQQIAVAVGGDAVVLLTQFVHGAHVHHGLVEVGKFVQETTRFCC
jgi:hypothetical protein